MFGVVKEGFMVANRVIIGPKMAHFGGSMWHQLQSGGRAKQGEQKIILEKSLLDVYIDHSDQF